MNILKMLRSFRYGFKGIAWLVESENNARFHLLASVIVLLLGLYFRISTTEWAIVLTQVGLVWSAEALNTAIEKLCDFVSPQHHETIGKVKDLAAGGVLIVSIVAAIIGLIVFLPKIWDVVLKFQ